MDQPYIYVASSWRNPRQPAVVRTLRQAGFDVYDFREPEPGVRGFNWSDIDPAWESWTVDQFRKALEHPIAIDGFKRDMQALARADATVLVMPCGRSAHLELGWARGAGKLSIALMEHAHEPELMYAMLTHVTDSIEDVVATLKRSF